MTWQLAVTQCIIALLIAPMPEEKHSAPSPPSSAAILRSAMSVVGLLTRVYTLVDCVTPFTSVGRTNSESWNMGGTIAPSKRA